MQREKDQGREEKEHTESDDIPLDRRLRLPGLAASEVPTGPSEYGRRNTGTREIQNSKRKARIRRKNVVENVCKKQ